MCYLTSIEIKVRRLFEGGAYGLVSGAKIERRRGLINSQESLNLLKLD